MKSSELRIENFIRLIENKKIVKCDSETIYQGVDEYFEGIPITEEWLLKFGFEKRIIGKGNNISSYRLEIKRLLHIHLRFQKDQWNFAIGISGYILSIKYVHQLQNLYFALTGEELITPKP